MAIWQSGRRAVVDIGSNTIKVLVLEHELSGSLSGCGEQVREARLAGGGAHLEPAAMAAGVVAAAELVAWARARDADEVALVATAAVRRADNRDEFVAAVGEATGLPVRILSGDEEAQLIGLGLRQDPGVGEWPQFLQIDQGGGSMELIEHGPEGCLRAISLPLGAVRVTRECIADPALALGAADRTRVHDHALQVLGASGFELGGLPHVAVLTGGGMIAAAEQLRGTAVATASRPELEHLAGVLAGMPLVERLARGVSPGRADILPAGLWAVLAVLEAAGVDTVRTSVHNLRWGVAAAWAAGEDWGT